MDISLPILPLLEGVHNGGTVTMILDTERFDANVIRDMRKSFEDLYRANFAGDLEIVHMYKAQECPSVLVLILQRKLVEAEIQEQVSLTRRLLTRFWRLFKFS